MRFLILLLLFCQSVLAAPVIPDGKVTTSKLADSAVTEIKIADDAVTSAKIAAGTITSSDISPSAAIPYTSLNLAGAITSGDLSSSAVTSSNISWNITTSSSSGNYTQDPCSLADVTNLSVSFTASGNKNVVIELVPDGTDAFSYFYFRRNVTEGGAYLQFRRNTTTIARVSLIEFNPNSGGYTGISMPVYTKVVDFAPAAGTYTYKVQLGAHYTGSSPTCGLTYTKMMVYEQ